MELMAGGALLRLLPERAVYLPEHHTLLVADAHIGKAQSFRRLGVPVPGGTTAATLGRLSRAVAATGAQRVVFLGDLLHSAQARAAAPLQAFADWRTAHAGLALTLVRGNHDDHAGDPPASLGRALRGRPAAPGPTGAGHHPAPLAGRYVLAGHLHPAAIVAGRGPGRLRLPCFHFGPAVGVLPAFGDFTGMHVMPRGPDDRVVVIAEDSLRTLNSSS
jgi:DNA ligase-associated metallophosphoesterase